jgi:SSS family solute:Na+ symporter
LSLLAVVLIYTVLGGMLSVLVTDYLQFLVMGAGIVVASVLTVQHFGWSNIVDGLWNAYDSGTTLIATRGDTPKECKMAQPFNPFVSKGQGYSWVFWQAVHALAVVTTWQTTIARVLAARDSATAKQIYRRCSFYWVGRFALPGIWGIGAFLYFVNKGGLEPGLDNLTAMPRFLGHILPAGLLGLMIAAMLAAEMSTDSGYLLTWATVIYNDLIGPCLRKPLSARAKLLTVRLMVLAIGLFLVFYGLVYKLKDNAWDYLAVTGDIYLASLFALLVAGLYWRKANSWGAIAAIVCGAAVPLAFVVVNGWMDEVHKIPAATAGWASFGMAFAGMIFGSWIANALGKGRGNLDRPGDPAAAI